MVYDPALGGLLLFGGTSATANGLNNPALNDTWEFSASGWTELCTAGCRAPAARWDASIAESEEISARSCSGERRPPPVRPPTSPTRGRSLRPPTGRSSPRSSPRAPAPRPPPRGTPSSVASSCSEGFPRTARRGSTATRAGTSFAGHELRHAERTGGRGPLGRPAQRVGRPLRRVFRGPVYDGGPFRHLGPHRNQLVQSRPSPERPRPREGRPGW